MTTIVQAIVVISITFILAKEIYCFITSILFPCFNIQQASDIFRVVLASRHMTHEHATVSSVVAFIQVIKASMSEAC